MEEKYYYETSDTNFAGYLFYLGFEGEPKLVENGNSKIKIVFWFEGDSKRQFIDIFNNYKFEEVKINLAQFIKHKDETFGKVRLILDTYHKKKIK